MAGKHKITATRPQSGHRRSFSMRATPRKFLPNLQTKRVFVPELNRYIRVQVTARELRTIDRIGLVEFMKRQGRSVTELI